MDQTISTFEKFDGYEIAQVVEYAAFPTDEGEADSYCERWTGTSEELEIERATQPDYRADFWTLYGHIPGEGVLAIGDFKAEADALEILARIGGTRNH